MTSSFGNIIDRAVGFGQAIATSDKGGHAELILGPYRTGKTTLLIDELIAASRKDPFATSLVVVPSARYRALFEKRLHERLKATSASGATVGILGVQVLPFYKACEFVLRKVGVPFQLIPEHVRVAVISRVLAELKREERIQTLEPIIGFSGTHSALLDLIDELQRAALLPEQVIAKLEETAQSEARYIELARIYQRYCDQLSELQYLDERGAAFAARSLLSQHQDSLRFGFVAADGFDRFNLLQLHVLEGLSQHAQSTKVCFDYVQAEHDATNEYTWKDASFSDLKAVFHRASHRVISQQKAVPQQEQKLFKTLDRFFEASEVARIIKQRIVDGGNPRQFLVVARTISAYSPAIHAAFEGAGVNYFLDEAVQLESLPVVQMILKLIEMSTVRKFKRVDLIACLRSTNFRLASVCESERDLSRLDKLSLEAKVVDSRAQWIEMVTARRDKFSDNFVTSFTSFINDLQPPLSGLLSDYINWVEDLLDRYLNFSTDGSDDQFNRWEEHRAVAEVRRALASLLHEQNICGGETCLPEYFLSRLRTLLERSNFRRVPRNSDYVTVCGADLAPNCLFDEVFVLGMTEGEFPKKARQAGFLSSDEVAGWLSFGIDIRNPRYHPAFETALFGSLVQRARTKVHLSCPIFEVSGEELIPSYLLTGGDENVAITYCSPFAAAGKDPVSAREAISAVLWQADETDILNLRSNLPLTTLVETLSEPLYIARARLTRNTVGHLNGDLREMVATGALSLSVPAQWSPSRLNDYGKCPFRYWLSHVVGAERQVEPESKLHPMVLGETYHKALELFYQTLLARKLQLRTLGWEEASRLFQSAVNAALALLDQRTDVRHGEFWRYDRNEISFRLKRFFFKEYQRAQQDQEQFVPLLTEASFGLPDAQSRPNLKIRHNGRDLVVRGRIDRIDIAESTIGSDAPRLRVVDYKAGSSAITKDDAFSGRNIQLPIYALAAERSIMPGAKVVSAQYLSISSGEPIGRLSFDPPERNRNGEPLDLLGTVEQHVRDFVSGIASGDFSVRPNHRSVCSKCDHRSVCRIAELPEQAKVSNPESGAR